MSDLITSDQMSVVVGLGKTGLAVARFLKREGHRFAVIDTRDNPPGLEEFRAEMPEIELHLGGYRQDWLDGADELVVSPGLSLKTPEIAQALAQGARAIGDIELFCRKVKAPIIAITGSNGKSTVTTLVGEMAAAAGVAVEVGGNIGTPVLDLLERPEAELYVLELSSFQLETTHSLRAVAATILNISPDHMDRYRDLAEYHQAKQRIYRGCRHAVINGDDLLCEGLLPSDCAVTRFTLGTPDLKQYGLRVHQGETWLARGLEPLLPVRAMKMRGRHNQANALAALALIEAAGVALEPALEALQAFTGLAHRCQWAGDVDGVIWFNDSKATNVGAALAAIEGLGAELEGEARLILLAGGDGKGAEFDELAPAVARYVRTVVLIGNDAERIAAALPGAAIEHAGYDFARALELCRTAARPGDRVVLAPACASFDMFDNFNHRGDCFMAAVREMMDAD